MACYSLDGHEPHIAQGAYIAPSVQVIGHVVLSPGASAWFGAVLRGDNDPIRIGPDSNVQDGAVIHADPGAPTTIGNGVTIGHRAIIHGATVGDNCLIGMGATILNNARIAANSIVGANALVTEGKSFPEGSLIVGAPARAVRPLREEEIAAISLSARTYVANAARYAKGLTRIG
jgi:carbonic anhydrase/acetyltransferase-like protein (isoleucine patch superfamily)